MLHADKRTVLPLQLRLHGVELLRHVRADVGASDPVLRGQDVGAVGDRDARVDETLERREQAAALRGSLHADVEHRFLDALRGRLLAGEESREVRRREVAGAGGPAVVLELERLRRRDHAVSRGIRGHELHDRLVERLPHDGPRLLASEELRADPVVGAAFPPSAERHAVVRTLARHAFASFSAPEARSCCSRCDLDLNMPPFACL